MIEYNTALPKLVMREYGRTIQKLVEHCVSIPEREERTKCAYAIADIMKKLFPELNGNEEGNPTVWQHINMIAGCRLDIDYPVEVPEEDEKKVAIKPIPYALKSDRFRVYGGNMVKMVQQISDMEGGIEKDRLIFLVANQMKKLLVNVNNDSATDARVFNDIKEITKGGIDIDPSNYRLNDYIGVNNQNEPKKKKKK